MENTTITRVSNITIKVLGTIELDTTGNDIVNYTIKIILVTFIIMLIVSVCYCLNKSCNPDNL